MISGKDCKGRILRSGDSVIMPEPDTTKGDIWSQGNFVGTIEGAKEFSEKSSHLIIVVDSEGNCFDIEPGRVCLDDDCYPIYGSDDMKSLPEGLYLGLFHGFKNETEREDTGDWGSNGPVIGPVEYVQTTYAFHIKMKFVNSEDAEKYGLPEETIDEVSINADGCVEFDGMQYGDWTVFYHRNEVTA